MRVAVLILDIIGFVLSVPNTICAAACAGCLGELTKEASRQGTGPGQESASSVATFLTASSGVIFGVCVLAFIFGFVVYSKPKTMGAYIGGIIMLVAGVLQLLFVLYGGILGAPAGICLIIAGILAFLAKPAPAQAG